MSATAYKPLPIHTTPDGAFEYGYIRSPRDVVGKIEPFAQGWHVQKLSNGESSFEATREGVFRWIADWYDIADTPHPVWLRRELRSEGQPQ